MSLAMGVEIWNELLEKNKVIKLLMETQITVLDLMADLR